MNNSHLVILAQKSLHNLDSRSRHLLITMANKAVSDKYDVVDVTQSEIVRQTGLCHATVARCIKNLLRTNYIVALNGNLHLNTELLTSVAEGREIPPRELYINFNQQNT